MAWDYAEKKIREAMHLHRDNATRIRQQVTAWAMDDPKLLRALVKPHMVGITAHAVGRVMSGKTKPEPVAQTPPISDNELRATRPQPNNAGSNNGGGTNNASTGYNATGRTAQSSSPSKPQATPQKPNEGKQGKKDSFGMDILRTIAGGDTAQFGQENHNPPRRKQGVSQRHIDAIHAMIKKSSSD